MLTKQLVPNLIGGVSQQPPAVRNNDQCEEQINCWPSAVDGLGKRQPTQHIKKLLNALTSATGTHKYHFINRSDTEQYLLEFGYTAAGSLPGVRAYTLLPIGTKVAGDQLTVTDSGGTSFSYLGLVGLQTHKRYIKVHTVADHTFVLNQTYLAAVNTGTTTGNPVNPFEGYIFVRQGNYKTKYAVHIKLSGSDSIVTVNTWQGPGNALGGGASSSTPSATNAQLDSIKTDDIAEELALKINNLGIGLTATRPGPSGAKYGSIVKVTKTVAPVPTAFEPTDSVGDSTLSAIWVSQATPGGAVTYSKIPRVENYLPEICTHGFRVKIVGNAEILADNYYVKFVADEGSGIFGRGVWQEDLGYVSQTLLDSSSMPHILTRTFDGSGNPQFNWTVTSWLPKIVGDNTLNPSPSFVGKFIKNLFYYKQRFGILADDRVILTETNEPFNFWRTTLLTLEDTAPIDVINTYTPPSLANAAIAFYEDLILKSNRTQFVLRGGDILSPRTVQINPISHFESYDNLDPVQSGKSLFFGFKQGDFSGVREMYRISDANATYDHADVTQHIANYISGEIELMSLSSLEECLIAKATAANTLYVYKYLWSGNQKILNSWGKWMLPPNATIRSFMFIETTLWLAVEYPDGVYLEKIEVATGLKDASATFLTLLDRRVDQTKLTGFTYSAGLDETTFTIPYTLTNLSTEIPLVVQKVTGRIFQVASYTTTTITVRGNLTDLDFWVGLQYEKSYTFTRPLAKIPGGRGLIPLSEAKQICHKLVLEYNNSGSFYVDVTVGRNATYTTEVAGSEVSFGDPVVDTVTLHSGSKEIGIAGKSRDVVCKIRNSGPYPSQISSAEWLLTAYTPYKTPSV